MLGEHQPIRYLDTVQLLRRSRHEIPADHRTIGFRYGRGAIDAKMKVGADGRTSVLRLATASLT